MRNAQMAGSMDRGWTGVARRLGLALGLALLMTLGSGLARAQTTITPIPDSPLIDADVQHTCALRPSGAVECWGDPDDGKAADQFGPYIAVTTGRDHTCALTPDGAADCWGAEYPSNDGQAEDQPGPYVALSAARYHTCALTDDGAVDCWGDNDFGQATDQPGPYVALSTGRDHTCALTDDGAVDCWGDNYSEQLNAPTGTYVAISAGRSHTCALTTEGAAVCWGDNFYNQAADQPGPFVAISAGSGLTCALTADGTGQCWGNNETGQLNVPAETFTAIRASSLYACALTTEGTAVCWGDNDFGQLDAPAGPYGPYDGTPPTASPVADPQPNAAGWNRSAVTVTWNWTDNPGGSGLDLDTCTQATTSSGEGIQPLTATCQDEAGNTGEAEYTVRVDTTPPTLSPVVSPNPVAQGATATVTPNAQDALSGIASATCGALSTSTPGAKSVSCTATDRAGNTATASVQYTVAYRWSGFFQPVDNLPTVNQVKAGSAVPVKFSLGGNYGLAIFAHGYPASQAVACTTSAPLDDIEQTVTAGASGVHYDAASGQYSYVWKTDKSWTGSCRRLVLRLNDGTEQVALFKFK